jgi:hypothetical protein
VSLWSPGWKRTAITWLSVGIVALLAGSATLLIKARFATISVLAEKIIHYLIQVAAVVAIVSIVLGVLVVFHHFFGREQPPKSVGRLYWDSTRTKSLLSIFVICLFVNYVDDPITLAFIVAAAALIVFYHSVTELRLKRGWFGDNKTEAEELLLFISQHGGHGLPPGTRALAPVTPAARAAATQPEVPVGAHS